MPRTRTRLLLAVAAAATLLPASTAGAAPLGTLYVQQAERGAVERSGGAWWLRLQGPAPRVTTFTDRPARVGGSQRLRAFVRGWNRAFGDVAPNAALEIADAPASRDVVLVELGAPRLTRGVLRYRIRPLTKTGAHRLAALARRADRVHGMSFGRASLFIDDGGAAVSYTLVYSGPAATWGVTFDNATLDPSAIEAFNGGNYLIVLPSGVEGQAYPNQELFRGVVTGRMNLPATGPVTGTANIPAGTTIQLQLGDGALVTLPAGPFSVPAGP